MVCWLAGYGLIWWFGDDDVVLTLRIDGGVVNCCLAGWRGVLRFIDKAVVGWQGWTVGCTLQDEEYGTVCCLSEK